MKSELEEIKIALCATGRQMLSRGLVAGSWGNLSCRSGDYMLITPSGIDYDKMNPGDIAVIDLSKGENISKAKPSSEVAMHRLFYEKRRDIKAVIHTHSVYAGVLAVTRMPLPPILEDLAQVTGGEVSVAKYAPAGTAELAEYASAALGEKGAVLLANHGVVGVGRNLQEAFYVCQVVERSAQVYVFSNCIGSPRVLSDNEVKELRENYMNHYYKV